MVVEYVKYDNLELLEKAFNTGILNAKEFTKDFGRNLPLLLSHIKLSFIVSEISILEAYMLKRFSNGELIDIETYMEDNTVDKSKYPVTHRNMQSIFLLNKTINEDTDVSVKPGVMLFPTKCVEKKCLVTFQGSSVLSIIGTITRHSESFFMKINNIMKNYPDKSKEEIIKNLLVEGLLKEFYSFMTRKIYDIDLLTDSSLDSEYLTYNSIRQNEGANSFVTTVYKIKNDNSEVSVRQWGEEFGTGTLEKQTGTYSFVAPTIEFDKTGYISIEEDQANKN